MREAQMGSTGDPDYPFALAVGAPDNIFCRPEHAACGGWGCLWHIGGCRLLMGSLAYVYRPVAPASFNLELDGRFTFFGSLHYRNPTIAT